MTILENVDKLKAIIEHNKDKFSLTDLHNFVQFFNAMKKDVVELEKKASSNNEKIEKLMSESKTTILEKISENESLKESVDDLNKKVDSLGDMVAKSHNAMVNKIAELSKISTMNDAIIDAKLNKLVKKYFPNLETINEEIESPENEVNDNPVSEDSDVNEEVDNK